MEEIEREILFEVPRGSIPTDYSVDEGYYQCPNCGEFRLWKQERTKIGECNNCGEQFRFHRKTQMFVEEVE